MDAVTPGNAGSVAKRPGILYPLMLIAAIAVIVFSIAGIATMMGWLPGALSSGAQPAGARPAGASRQAAPRIAAGATACRDCGVVESLRAVEMPGEGSGLGAVAGGVVGGILGNQVGRGRGRTAATVVGAGAGAYAGHEIEKQAKKSVSYEIRVRMSDGAVRTLYQATQPALTVGQKVRVTDQGVIAG